MLAAERIRRIKDIIIEYRHIDVNTLSTMLNVSESTIRKDLEKLEQEGFVNRIYGGAVLNTDENEHALFLDNTDPFIDEKRKIGEIASKLIIDNDVIFLGMGSVCTQIAKNLTGINLTIITNNISAIVELVSNPNNTAHIIGTGGDITTDNRCIGFEGKFAIDFLEGILINKAFLTVDGFSIKNGYTVNSKEQVAFYNVLKKISEEIIIVADYSKANKTAMLKLDSITSIRKIVSNENILNEYKKFFYDSEIQLFTTIGTAI